MINGLGDIFVLIQITAVVAKKLNAARHAPAEVKDLIEDAEAFRSCVVDADDNIRRHGAILKPHDGLKRNIIWILRRCDETAQKLHKIAIAYEGIVKEEGAATAEETSRKQWARALKTVYQSVRWTTIKDAVKDLRKELLHHIQILHFMSQQLLNRQVDRLVEMMGSMGITIEQIGRLFSSTMLSPSIPPMYASNPQSPSILTPLSSPFVLSPNEKNDKACESPFGGIMTLSPSVQNGVQQNSIPQMEDLELPQPSMDIYDFNFAHKLDLELPDKFPNPTPGDGYRNVKLASDKEQDEFIKTLIDGTEYVEYPIECVEFVYQRTPSSNAVVIAASDSGKVLLLKNGNAVSDIWTLNNEKTIRFLQRVPLWDEIIPYSSVGEASKAVIEQGAGLLFVTFEKGKQITHSVPTSWVTYTFKHPEDCKQFQEHLYGWDLLLTVPVREIYKRNRIKDDDHLVGCQNIRIWRSRTGPGVRFMVRLSKKKGRKRYLEFDLMQEALKVEAKDNGRRSRLAFSGIAMVVDEGSLERRDSMNSVSSVSSASSRSSIIRKLSWGDNSEFLQNIIVCFDDQKHRDRLHRLVLNCQAHADF